MAGHNKWSKIKRQKAVTDARRSKAWARVTRDIMLAVRDGSIDPAMNARLALAVDKAKEENMPRENIERAIKRGSGEIEGAEYEEVVYEGYAPGGVAVLVETLTDNTNRTVADLRSLFSKAGGSLGQAGSVAYLFDRKGALEIPARGQDELELFDLVAEAGAEDLQHQDDVFVVTTSLEAFGSVQQALAAAGIRASEAGLVREPTTTVSLAPADARKVIRLLEAIEEHQDVQEVYSTLEVDEDALATF